MSGASELQKIKEELVQLKIESLETLTKTGCRKVLNHFINLFISRQQEVKDTLFVSFKLFEYQGFNPEDLWIELIKNKTSEQVSKIAADLALPSIHVALCIMRQELEETKTPLYGCPCGRDRAN